jgi:hypothetical protein
MGKGKGTENVRPAKKKSSNNNKGQTKDGIQKNSSASSVENNPPVTVQPPSWGRGRSFADVLRKENETAAAAAPKQSV